MIIGAMMIMTPFVLLISMYILAVRFGWYGLFSLACFLYYYPFQILFAKLTANSQRLRYLHSDNRVKICNEFIEGVRLIKLYGWEEYFRKKAGEVRQKEIARA